MHEGHRERMRERLLRHADSMSEHELLEVLLYYTIPRQNTNPAAHELLDRFGGLGGVFSAPPEAVEQAAGVGRRTAELVFLVGRLLERIREGERSSVRLNCFADIVAYAGRRFDGRATETLEFYCIGAGGKLLCTRSFGGGRKTNVTLHSRELNLLLASVAPLNLVAAHNHPSGSPQPSEEDDDAVAEIYRICRINGVQLSDCLIFADGEEPYSYFHEHRFEKLGIDRSNKDQYIIKSNKLKKVDHEES